MGRFNFTGKVRVNGQDTKYPAYRNGKTKSGDKYSSINFFVNAADNNSANVEIFGMISDEIRAGKDEDGNERIIKWEDRKDKSIVDEVDNFRKHVMSLGDNDDRQSFIAPYDAVEFLNDNITELKGKRVTVTGRITKNEYNGKISDRFQIQNVYLAGEDKKDALTIVEEIFFNKDSIDTSDFKEEKKILVSAYTKEYIDKEHPAVYVPCTLVIDCSKIDLENEQHVKIFNARYAPINLKYEKGKITVNLKGNKYYSIMAEIRYFNGAEAEEFTEADLTEMQKMQLEAGIKSLEDFRPSGMAYGNRTVIYKLVNFDVRGEYSDGCVALDDTVAEFEDNIYVVDTEDSKGKKSKKKDDGEEIDMNEPKEENEDFEDDLFG